MRQNITPTEALETVLGQIESLPVETVPHDAALGRTLARDIVSDIELPPFDNSAMDGYAVIAADAADASEESPATLRVLDTIAAGDLPQQAVTRGACARIMTGAPMPPGADAVVMREETREQEREVQILAAARPGQNIRRAGFDVARGETVLSAGSVVRAAEWGMLASLNQAQIEVARQPRVGIITTGEELVAVGAAMSDSQIRDSNSFTLEGLARATGALVTERRHVGDAHAPLQAVLHASVEGCDAIITSGGVSAGDYDPVRDVLQQIADVHFWKIAMKPGKPVMFATLRAMDNRVVPIFGLPGNPVSVMVTFEQFVRPALLKMQNRRATRRIEVQAVVDSTVRSPAGKVDYIRALVQPAGDGWIARVAGEQSSGRLSTMTRSNALLIVPAEAVLVEAGQRLTAQMTEWPEID